jgi:hypothetical protein
MQDPNVRHFSRSRQEIIEHCRRERLTLRVERHFLVETCADAPSGAAVNFGRRRCGNRQRIALCRAEIGRLPCA